MTGEYFIDKKPGRRTRKARNDEAAKQLWELTEGLLGENAERTRVTPTQSAIPSASIE